MANGCLAADLGIGHSFTAARLSLSPSITDVGLHTVQLKAVDPSGNAAFQTFTLRAKGPNTPPEITTTAVTTVAAGGTYRCDVDAIDSEDAAHFELTGAPAGIAFDTTTGQIVWHTSLYSTRLGMRLSILVPGLQP